MNKSDETWVVAGASRGIGLEFVKQARSSEAISSRPMPGIMSTNKRVSCLSVRRCTLSMRCIREASHAGCVLR